jgi:hypothetical protein
MPSRGPDAPNTDRRTDKGGHDRRTDWTATDFFGRRRRTTEAERPWPMTPSVSDGRSR